MEINFKPTYAIHPGVFLKEELDEANISQKKLSELSGINKTIINEIIKGKRDINGEVAVKLESVLYSSAKYWLNLQSIYDEAKARVKLGKNQQVFNGAAEWDIDKSEEQLTVYVYPYNYRSIA